MNKEEQELFLELCKVAAYNGEKLKSLLSEHATPAVLGELFYNRMAGVAYDILQKNKLTDAVNREFRNSLENAYLNNIRRNISFYECVNALTDALHELKGKYAMLKGALLCGLYPKGCRTSNDIDILIEPKNIGILGDALKEYGFAQGHIKSGRFVPADRSEIISSRMMRGETIPYILEVKLPFMRYLEIDINFSLDYKNSDSKVLKSLIDNSVEAVLNESRLITLNKADFLIYLCNHLYKEATVMPWIKMKRDMCMYKYCDIYMQINGMGKTETVEFFKRANELNMSDICSCVILWTTELLHIRNDYAVEMSFNCLNAGKNMDILNEIISPAEKKKYRYKETDIRKRFFAEDRAQLLEEM